MFKSKYYLSVDAIARAYQQEKIIGTFTYDKNFDVYENAIILPLKRNNIPTKFNGKPVVCGGVVDENFNPVAGYRRVEKSKGMIPSEYIHPYKPDEIGHSDETVIFSGDFINHFGHFVTECLPRMWYAASNDRNLKIAILLHPREEWKEWKLEGSYHLRMLELLGIQKDRILLVDKPTQFKSVVVPRQPVFWDDLKYNKELLIKVYDKVRNSVVPMEDKRIYLSRTAFSRPLINEEYFEDFFSSRGFKILHTQDLPLDEQISYLAGAEEIACTNGTLSHLVLFAKPGTKLICLLRGYGQITPWQLLIDQIKQIDSTYIDVSFNFLPVQRNRGYNLLAPTAMWKEFIHNEYGAEDNTDIFDYLDHSDIKFGAFFKHYLRDLGSKGFFNTVFGYNFNPFPHLKNLYNLLDPDNVGRLASAVKNTNTPLFRGKLFIYKIPDKNIRCIVKLLASGGIWKVDSDGPGDIHQWSYLGGRLYFLNGGLHVVSEFVVDGVELRNGHAKYKGVFQPKVSDVCTLETYNPGALRNWIIKHTIKYLVNSKRYKKLKKKPDRFFRDSKNMFIRFLGRYYIRGNSTVIYYWRKKFQEYFDTHDIRQKVSNLKLGMDDISVRYIDNFMRLSEFWYKSTCVGSQWTDHDLKKQRECKEFAKTLVQPFPDILTVKPYFFYDIYGLADLPKEVLAHIDGKVIIDGGGLNGDTAITFHHHFPNSEIHVYEPLEHYVNIINRFLAEDNCNYKIMPVNKGLGDKIDRQFMRFGAGANMADITTIDTEYNDATAKIGLIKLNVEGMETQIIKGAKAVIARDRPVLAIAIYHRPEDFFELKDKIKELNPAYRFMIRKSEPSLPQADLVLIAY